MNELYTLDKRADIESRLEKVLKKELDLKTYVEGIAEDFARDCDKYEIPAYDTWRGETALIPIAELATMQELYVYIADNGGSPDEVIESIKTQADALKIDI